MSERYSPRRSQHNKPRHRNEWADLGSVAPTDQANTEEPSADQGYVDTQLHQQIAKAQASEHRTSLDDAMKILFPVPSVNSHDNPGASGEYRERRKNQRRAHDERIAAAKRNEQLGDATGTVDGSSEDALAIDTSRRDDEAEWSVHTYDAQPYMDALSSTPAEVGANAVAAATADNESAPHAPENGDAMNAEPSEAQSAIADSDSQDGDAEPGEIKRVKQAKKPKKVKPQQSQQVSPDDDTSVTYDQGDQPFGPVENPVHLFLESETYKDARTAYDQADKELAGKVARRLKLGMFTTKKTREAASADIETARPEYERMAETFDAIQIEKWKLKNPAISDEEINHKLAKFHEAKLRLQGLRAQNEIVTSTGKFGKLSEWNNKATEWYAGLSKAKKVGFAIGGLAVGVVAGGLVATAGTLLGATAGVAGGGLLAGAKIYKTTMQGRAGLHRNMSKVDKADFKNADGSYKSIDELRTQSSVSFKKGLDQRVERADKVNKKTKWMTIASAALLGVGVAGHIDAVHDVYKAVEGNVADYFGMANPHDVIPSGGGQGGSAADHTAVSPDNNVAPTHDVDHYVPKPPAPAPEPSYDTLVPQDMGGATEFNGAGLDHFNEWANGHTVQPGESIWKLSQDYLQANGVKNPSVYQIDAVKDKVLAEFSAKGLVDGNGWLQAGQQLFTK